MKKFHLRTVKYINSQLKRLDQIITDIDLPELHRMSVDIQTSLPENIVHENRPLYLEALRINKEENIPEYGTKLQNNLRSLRDEYRKKAGI